MCETREGGGREVGVERGVERESDMRYGWRGGEHQRSLPELRGNVQ